MGAHGVNGFIVKDRDPIALYEAIKKLISDPALREKMGEASRRIIAETASYERMVDAFVDVVDYCLRRIGK